MTRQHTVLLVEDEEPIRRIIKLELEKASFLVSEAENGREAVGIALTDHPDVILLDVLMPKMHGMEMVAKLRETEWGKQAKVILLTNYADDPKVRESVDKGYCHLLKKSETKLENIVAKVRDVLGTK